MKLVQYLKEEGLKKGDFARKIPAHPATLRRWITGESTPLPIAQDRIEKLTKGKVTPKDWKK